MGRGGSGENMKAIEIKSVGQPKTERLGDWQLDLIVRGLIIPSQGAGKSMAEELLERRNETDLVRD